MKKIATAAVSPESVISAIEPFSSSVGKKPSQEDRAKELFSCVFNAVAAFFKKTLKPYFTEKF